jgi:hypothetical protein
MAKSELSALAGVQKQLVGQLVKYPRTTRLRLNKCLGDDLVPTLPAARRWQSVFRRGSRRVHFQLMELLFERGKARYEPAIGLVAGRFFLNPVPAFGRVLLGPRPVLFGIEDLLLDEISQRAVILLQIEDAIPRLEIKMLAVELTAEFQPAGKGLLRHARINNLALEVVNCLILRAGRGQRHQA